MDSVRLAVRRAKLADMPWIVAESSRTVYEDVFEVYRGLPYTPANLWI
jgi:hypothetical protein